MAARRATVATSPFGASPAATRAAAAGDMRTTARARAQRTVSAFSLTSTMRAFPAASRCVSVPSTSLMVLARRVDTAGVDGMMAAVARLGTLAFERTPLPELTDVARESAAAALGCEIRCDERNHLVADRPLTPEEAAFLTALDHVLAGAGHARHRDALTGLPNRVLLE